MVINYAPGILSGSMIKLKRILDRESENLNRDSLSE